MVDSIQQRSDLAQTPPSTTTASSAGQSGGGFASLLAGLADTVADAVQPGEPADGATGASMLSMPAGAGVSQALHYLMLRIRDNKNTTDRPLFDGSHPSRGAQGSHRVTDAASSTVATTSGVKALNASYGVTGRAMTLADYPRPANDNGRGVHWIPTTGQSTEVVDRFVERAQSLGMKWVTFLNKPTDLESNQYLASKLRAAGIMPVMRIYTDSGAALSDDITPLVKQYRQMGVSYFQLFNEPNLACENQGQTPQVSSYVDKWIPAARQVLAAGGLPGIGALSPQGDVDDVTFLKDTLQQVQARGAGDLLNRAWVSVHNYGTDYLRVRQYDSAIRQTLGRSLPQIGTEAGIYPGGTVTAGDQQRVVSGAYNYLEQREPYYFAYSLWVLANQAGGGHDGRWEQQALYRTDGPSDLAKTLEQTLSTIA